MSDLLRDRIIAAIGDQYALDREIGRGGMSVVYRARDLRLNRMVAVKVLPPDLAYESAVRMRFTREAQTSAQLAHPHIVPIYDVGDRDGIAFFVMAIVSGGNLATLLAREPRQPIGEVRRILREVADALAWAHQCGVVHRDIKPDNILLDGDTGRAMVTDFGIARAMEVGPRVTATGIAIGTPAYMSPEQATSERRIDGRSDIYSLGVLGYQMLTGRLPFTASSSVALLLKHVTERPRPIADLRPDAPRTLREAVERALMKDPEDRWPTAAALRDVLASDETAAPAWRAGRQDPVRYESPRRGSSAVERQQVAPPPPVLPGAIVLEPAHLASLTPEQREDLRLWHGRVNLLDRVKVMRRYSWFTFALTLAAFGGVAGAAEIPPLVLGPLIPFYMSVKAWRRGKLLRQSGLKVRRVLLVARARWALPAPPPAPTEQQLEKLAPREILESPQGAVIRRAAEDREAILHIVANLPKADRALFKDLEPTIKALVERVAQLARMLHVLDQSIDWGLIDELDGRIAKESTPSTSPDAQRRLALLRRQRATLQELVQRREALARQLDSAGLALGNLRLDLIKFRSSGGDSAVSDVSTATQEARALAREIDVVLEAAAAARDLG